MNSGSRSAFGSRYSHGTPSHAKKILIRPGGRLADAEWGCINGQGFRDYCHPAIVVSDSDIRPGVTPFHHPVAQRHSVLLHRLKYYGSLNRLGNTIVANSDAMIPV